MHIIEVIELSKIKAVVCTRNFSLLDFSVLVSKAQLFVGNESGPLHIAAVMGTENHLINRLKVSAQRCGEKLWELPLEEEYESHIKSKVADVKNTGNPMMAGTIIGGLFLKNP